MDKRTVNIVGILTVIDTKTGQIIDKGIDVKTVVVVGQPFVYLKPKSKGVKEGLINIPIRKDLITLNVLSVEEGYFVITKIKMMLVDRKKVNV